MTLIDGTAVDGVLERLAPAILVLRDDETTQRIAVDDVADVEFPHAYADGPALNAWWVYPAAGGRLAGDLLDGPAEMLHMQSLALRTPRIDVPFGHLAALVRIDAAADAQAQRLFDAAMAERAAGEDVLITRGPDEARTVRGTLLEIGPTSAEFMFNGRARRLAAEKIFGLVFAAGAENAATGPVDMILKSGDRLTGRLDDGPMGSVALVADFGEGLMIPFPAIASMAFASPRVVSLSGLTPVSQSTEGIVHEDWPYRSDRNVGNGPLVLGGKTFAHGLGVHSRSSLRYELEQPYESFAATVGIDDAVRPGGSVEFIVMADRREAYRSGTLTGTDAPRNIFVPLEGARSLTLIVDYADRADVGDWADWADARLILPKRPSY